MKSLRLLLDQMIDADIATDLRAAGHDVCCVADIDLATADDAEILQAAIRDDRILVTLDRHFGDWAVLPLKHHPGVIRIKASPTTTESIQSVLHPFLGTHGEEDFADSLVIVGRSGLRRVHTTDAETER